MAINMSKLITRIKKDLGIYGLVLPLKNGDNDIAETIKDTTRPTFSRFFPDDPKITLKLSELEIIKNQYQESIYIIPDIFGKRDIISIKKVSPRSLLLSGGYYAPYIDSSPELYYGMMMAQANADLISAAAPPFTFKFKEPNQLWLYNITTMYGELDIEFNVVHADNLSTVKTSTYETFYELAVIDIKNFLYGALKHYKNIQTAYGTITLEIDDWANAPNDRKDLVERWRDVYTLEQEQIYVI
jgi:hypothetical protein